MEEEIKTLIFTRETPNKFLNNNKILNFLNLESLWHYKNNILYSRLISQKHNINFPDGRLVGLKLGIKQQRGPTFTRNLLTSKLATEKKHFFIGGVNIKKISKITAIAKKRIKIYNPSYIKELEFSYKEKIKITTMLKKFKPDYIWVCVGAPKQEILANQLFKLYPSNYFNVGAALDFLVRKKSEAPRIWRKLGLEWAYRGITDFKHSKKKIIRSFRGLNYFKDIKLEK